MAFLRVWAVLIVLLGCLAAVLYAAMWVAERRRLGRLWDEAGRPEPREAHVDEPLARHARRLSWGLFLGVFLAPMAALAVLLYVVNVPRGG